MLQECHSLLIIQTVFNVLIVLNSRCGHVGENLLAISLRSITILPPSLWAQIWFLAVLLCD